MRTLGLLVFCAIVFSGLFFALLQTTPEPVPAAPTSPAPPLHTGSAEPAPGFALRLDRTLSRSPTEKIAPPRETQPAASRPQRSLTPRHWTQFVILAAALLLGLFISRALRQRPARSTAPSALLKAPKIGHDDMAAAGSGVDARPHAPAELAELQQTLESRESRYADELAALDEQLGSRNVELNDARQRVTLLEQTIEDLRDEIKLNEERFGTEKQAAREAHASDVDAYEESLRTLTADLEQARAELEARQERLDQETRSKEALRTDLDAANADLTASSEIISELENTRIELADQIAALEEQAALAESRRQELDELGASYDEARQTGERLSAELDELKAEFERVEKRARTADELETVVEELREELEKATTARDESFAELGELHHLFNQAQTRANLADELEEEVSQLKLDLESVAKAREAAEEEVYTLTTERDGLRRDLEEKERQLVALEERANSTTDELQTRLRELDEKQSELSEIGEELTREQQQLETLQEKYDALVQQELDVQQRLEEERAQRQELQTEHSALLESSEAGQRALTTLQEQHETLRQSEQELRDELQKQRDHGDSLKSEIETLTAGAEEQKQALDTLQKKHDELLEVEQTLRTALQETGDHNVSLESENSALAGSIEVLREDLAGMVVKLGEKKEQIQSWQEQLADEKRLVIDQQNEIEGLRETLDERNQRVAALSEELLTVGEMEQRLAAWDNSLQTYRSDIEGKNRLIDKLRDLVSESHRAAAQSQRQVRTVEQRLKAFEELQGELYAVRDAHNELTRLLDEQQSNMDELRELEQTQSDALSGHAQSLQELDEERERWLQELRTRSATVSALESDLHAQRDTLKSVEALFDDALAAPVAGQKPHSIEPASNASDEASESNSRSLILRKGQALLDTLERADKTYLELSTQTDSLRSEIEESATRIEAVEAARDEVLDRAEQERLTLVAELDDTRRSLDERTQTLAELRTAFDATRDEQQRALSAVAQARESQAEAEAALTEARGELQVVERELADYKTRVRNADGTLGKNQATLRALSAERDELKHQLDDAERKADAHRQKHDNTVRALKEAQQQYSASEQSLRASLAEQQKANRELSTELTVLRDRLEKVSAVPVLTHKVAEGNLTIKSSTKNIPVLGQPVSSSDRDGGAEVPVLDQPVKPEKS